MLIVAIEESRRYRGRFELIFDDGTRLMTSKDVIAENYLHSGKEMTEEDIENLKTGFIRDETRRKAIDIINRRPLSKYEVQKKLIEKGETPENSAEAAQWLEELGLIDDREYALLVVSHYSAKGYGPRRVRDELYRRGVSKDYWDEAMSQMPQQDDEIDRFIMSKLGGEMPDRREKKRVSDALARRGFSWSDIASAFRRYEESAGEEETYFE